MVKSDRVTRYMLCFAYSLRCTIESPLVLLLFNLRLPRESQASHFVAGSVLASQSPLIIDHHFECALGLWFKRQHRLVGLAEMFSGADSEARSNKQSLIQARSGNAKDRSVQPFELCPPRLKI
eukprot:244955-Amphidinium_carterae.2